jgi:hypothetical protein
MAIVTQATAVINAVYQDLIPALKLDMAAWTEFEQVSVGNRATAGRFIFNTPLASDTTTVDPAVGATALTTFSQKSVDVTMALKGNAGHIVTGAHMLNGAAPTDAAFNAALSGVLVGAARTRNALIMEALLTVPAYNVAWVGPDGVTYNTSTQGLVYLGAQTAATRLARNLITTGDWLGNTAMFTAKQACDKLYTRLLKDGVEPMISMDGEVYYPCFLHPNQMYDIKQGIGVDLRTINAGNSLVTGKIPAYGGLAFIEDATCVSIGTGAGGINVYMMIALGKKYLLKAALPAEALPIDGPRVEERRNIADDMELRIVSGLDTSGYSRNLVWSSYLGYDVGLALAGYRLETYSSLG